MLVWLVIGLLLIVAFLLLGPLGLLILAMIVCTVLIIRAIERNR